MSSPRNAFCIIAVGASLLSSASASNHRPTSNDASLTSVNILYNFQGGSDGEDPFSALTLDPAGNLYGTTQRGGISRTYGGTVFRISPNGNSGWDETVLHVFQGKPDGQQPFCNIAIDAHGNLYGTTPVGGPNQDGVVFQLIPKGDGTYLFRTLYAFTGGTDGAGPYRGVIIDKAGNLYGTTNFDGANSYGTVFKLTRQPGGTFAFSVIHNFGGPGDGISPYALIFDAHGNIYGATDEGGLYNRGVVFELARDQGWSETILYSFTGELDGGTPNAAVTLGPDGNLYGTTLQGGNITTCGYSVGCGTVYELTHSSNSGWTEKILFRFSGGIYGQFPLSQIAFDSFGNLYGTASEGGNLSCGNGNGCGIVFQMTPSGEDWTYNQLYSFSGGSLDGASPNAGVTIDNANNLYGTTTLGGTYGDGTVYEIPASQINAGH